MILHDDEISAAHRGVAKPIDLIYRTYRWKHMNQEIKQFANSCHLCQQNKISNQAPKGLLHPIPTPDTKWHKVTMDFITSLPKTKAGNDCITVWVDKLTKMAKFAATIKTVSATDAAKLTFDNVVRHHAYGVPIRIISDRDPRFTSTFWSSLWKLFVQNQNCPPKTTLSLMDKPKEPTVH
jgi:hypothetical protein